MRYSNILIGLGFLTIPPAFVIKHEVTESASKQATVAVATQTDHSKDTGLAKVVYLAEAFKATLSTDQQAILQRTFSKADAVRWSNFPQMAARPSRVGLSIGSLNTTQRAAFETLMGAVLSQDQSNEGLDELNGVMAADDYFGKTTNKTNTFGSTNYFIAYLGTPSITGLWELQVGGHHFAFADTYNKGELIGATPSFRGVEPMKEITAGTHKYQPIAQEQAAFADVINGLNDSQKTEAKLSGSYSDVILGPGKDGQFPIKKQGLKVGSLNAAQQKLVMAAIGRYVNDLDPASAKNIMKKYTADLPETYIGWTGTGKMDQTNDYVRIDGPGVWIEYAVQPSRDFPGTTHPHSVWRDHQSDYGGN